MPKDKTSSVSLQDRVTDNEAAKLMFHHLALAAAYFEATTIDVRKLTKQAQTLGDGRADAAAAFVQTLHNWYESI